MRAVRSHKYWLAICTIFGQLFRSAPLFRTCDALQMRDSINNRRNTFRSHFNIYFAITVAAAAV